MKKTIAAIIVFAGLASQAAAFTLSLPEPLSVPTATQIDIRKITIEETKKQLVVEYKFISASGDEIWAPDGRGGTRYWRCIDAPADAEDPVAKTCFSDVFGFTIREQDVGKKLGKDLWQVIWTKMKPDVLKVSGNDIQP